MRDASVLVLIALTFLGGSTCASAFELRSLEVTDEAGIYKVRYVARVNVPPVLARRYLLDIDHFDRLSDRVRESRVLARLPDGRLRIRLVFENCVLFLCKTTHRTATLEVVKDLAIVRTEPANSDFHYGHERWEARDESGTTVIDYRGDFVPKFWIPPIIDTWLIARYAKSEITKTGHRLEELARTPPALP